MNDTVLTIIQIVTPIIAAMVAWIMYGLSNRISTLEEGHDLLIQDKLDKADYHRDQGATRETLRQMQIDFKELSNVIRDLPEKMINILQKSGKL